jgi:hypothetical protein
MSAETDDLLAAIRHELERIADALEGLPSLELRDVFACVVLPAGVAAVVEAPTKQTICEGAYEWADAMLAARAKL